jgi:hypothetical protein
VTLWAPENVAKNLEATEFAGTLDEEDIRDPNKDYELLLWHPDNVAKNQEATDFATRIYREVYG